MPSHLASPWNYAVSYLDMLYGDQVLACGSGFFWKLNDRTLLVSAWHNFSGRNSETGVPMSETGGLPDRVRFTSYKRLSRPDADGFFEMATVQVTVSYTITTCLVLDGYAIQRSTEKLISLRLISRRR